MKGCRNWVEMPDELMLDIFQRLHTIEKLTIVRKVCTTWRRICKDPAMWKVINIRKWGDSRDKYDTDYVLETLTKQAVDLSSGELIDISIEWFGSDDLLDHIVLCSNKLKRLCLVSCFRITNYRLSLAVKKVPQLEELHLIDHTINAYVIGSIGHYCPQLRSFKLSYAFRGEHVKYDNYAIAIANSMTELRHLEVHYNGMANDGLLAILDGCPHLESLDVRMCVNLDFAGDLEKLCRQRVKHFKR